MPEKAGLVCLCVCMFYNPVNMKPNTLVGGVRRRLESSCLAGIKGKIHSHRIQVFHPTIFKSKHTVSMASTTSTPSFGQALQFITDIKLQELEKQRLAYQERAKVIDEVSAPGENGDILKKVCFK